MSRPFPIFTEAERAEIVRAEHLPTKITRMFEDGSDTARIAARLFMREADVHRILNIARSDRLGLPNPYRVQA